MIPCYFKRQNGGEIGIEIALNASKLCCFYGQNAFVEV